jgi:L-threonylcarbamoyladenylate synthase
MSDTVRIATDDPTALERAAHVLQHGGVIAFPTDTVYGLGAHAFLTEAIAGLYRIKGRPAHLPIPLLLPDAEAMRAVCSSIPSVAWQLARRFWPGGLSLVLPKALHLPDILVAHRNSVAVRVPDQDLIRWLCRQMGAPLAATSANRHGQPAPVTADEVEDALAASIPLLLDGGRCPGGMASTVLDLTVAPAVILRPGPITPEQLAAILPLAGNDRPAGSLGGGI